MQRLAIRSPGLRAAEGDGGLTVFTTRCSARVVKGLVELVASSISPSGSAIALAAVRAEAARERSSTVGLSRQGRAYGTMVRLVRRRALAGSPFAFVAAALRKALLGGGHADRLEGDDLRDLLQLARRRRAWHGTARRSSVVCWA